MLKDLAKIESSGALPIDIFWNLVTIFEILMEKSFQKSPNMPPGIG